MNKRTIDPNLTTAPLHRYSDKKRGDEPSQGNREDQPGRASKYIPHPTVEEAGRTPQQLPDTKHQEGGTPSDPPNTKQQQNTYAQSLKEAKGPNDPHACDSHRAPPEGEGREGHKRHLPAKDATRAKNRKKDHVAGNLDEPSSIATEHPLWQMADATERVSQPLNDQERRATSTVTRHTSPCTNEHHTEDRPKGIRRDNTPPNRTPTAQGKGHPCATDACQTEQKAKKRRRAAPRHSADPRDSADDSKKGHYDITQIGTHGDTNGTNQGNDEGTSDTKKQRNDSGQRRVSRENRPIATSLKQARSKVTKYAGDAPAGENGPTLHRAMTSHTHAAAARNTPLAEKARAHGENLARPPVRDRPATLYEATAKRHGRFTEQARMRMKACAHRARPREDAGRADPRPSKRNGARRRSEPGGPSTTGVGRVQAGQLPRPARGATKDDGKRLIQPRDVTNPAATAHPAKAQRSDNAPCPVPDARLSGRGWHDRWPPPASGLGDHATRLPP